MPIISIAGEAFNVLVEGDEDKPALLISNPLGTSLHLWDRQLPAFLEHFRVIRYDSRGHGDSVADEGPYSIASLGRDALAILDALGLEKVHWLGLSMGGIVGLWVLAHAPDRIDRAVLANTAAQIPGPDMWNSRIEAVREGGMDRIAESVAERWFTKDFRESDPDAVNEVVALLRATPAQGYMAACAAVRDVDLRESIRSITSPVLVIAGRHDEVAPPGMGALVASSIEGAQLVTLEASHISNVEDEANFTKAVIDFLTVADVVVKARGAGRRVSLKKTSLKKAPAKKARPEKGVARKVAARKVATRQSATRQAPARTSAARKALAKKALAKKAPPKKMPSKPAPSKKALTRKALTRKAPAKAPMVKAVPGKAPVKKVAAKKTPVTAAAIKKAAIKKASTTPTPITKAAVKKMPAKKTQVKKLPAKTAGGQKIAVTKGAAKKPAEKLAAKKIVAKKSGAKKSVSKKASTRKKP